LYKLLIEFHFSNSS